MKNKILSLLICLVTLPVLSFADNFVNLTPKPRVLNVGTEELVLPEKFAIGTSGLSDEMTTEVQKFVTAFNAATGYTANVDPNASQTLITVKKSSKALNEEGYKITVTTEGATIEANTAIGLYYAFQSIKKVLPANVMAGVRDAKITKYALPVVNIDDSPAYGYRGFMLDTSRHFFSVDELKRVLDVMSYYKMNRFHWHMTDDHGWRIEIKKYPKLTTVGSISDNSYMVDMHNGDFWLNKPYGPYFYTQEQVKDIVAYAKERHIEIVPEIDMPGHFSAAMAAYPEYSCTPNGSHQVVSNIGGVFSDVLNVANPGAVQFAKDILTEVMELFPGEYIHIGGDECPTNAWKNNAECIAKKNKLGLKSFRELQSHFIKDMADHLKANGRKICVWNEAITADGADTKTIKETGATVYCWIYADNAVHKAANLSLPHIYTPQIPWYINRKQSTDPNEPIGAGNGTDNLEKVYNQSIPVPNAKYFSGVQATFWCEYVAFNEYLEYLMLPRLVAIAEAGWTPKNKMNFKDFCKRITADSTLYNYNNYQYGKHYMTKQSSDEKVMPTVSTKEKYHWYRLVTQATDSRAKKCMELLSEKSPLIETHKAHNAAARVLWTNAQASESDPNYDYQFWALEENTENPGHYALVNKAQPDGSVNPTPTANNTSGRWKYDNAQKHYNFILADKGYGKNGNNYYYSIRCDKIEGQWMNAALGGQGFAVNLYNNPNDGQAGLWNFVPKEPIANTGSLSSLIDKAKSYLENVRTYDTPAEKRPGYFGATETASLKELVKKDPSTLNKEELAAFTTQFKEAYANFHKSFGYMEKDKIYTIVNTVAGFKDVSIYDNNKGNTLRNTKDLWSDNAWKVTESTINDDYSQSIKLQNVQTQRFIGSIEKNATARMGFAVNIANQGAQIKCTFNPATQDFVLSINGKNLYPVSETANNVASTIYAGSENTQTGNAIRIQGAAWNLIESNVVTFDCYDTNQKALGKYRKSWPVHAEQAQPTPPAIKNHEFKNKEGEKYFYSRNAYEVEIVCRDQYGAIVAAEYINHGINAGDFAFKHQTIPYYTFVDANYPEDQPKQLTDDITIEANYSSNALNGVKKLGEAVTEVKDGHSYVIYDMSPSDASRKGYRMVNKELKVNRNTKIENTDPNHTWLLEKGTKNFKVKNAYHDLYVPALKNSTPVVLSKNADLFEFTYNAGKETWKIKGSNGVCWDGLENGSLVGWNSPGHPYKIYEYFVQPYFTVAIEAVDTEGKVLETVPATLIKAGDAFTISTKIYEGYTLKEIQGEEEAKAVADYLVIKVIYEKENITGIEEATTEKRKNAIYDLSGRKLQRISHKGIYIINGQKVFVK